MARIIDCDSHVEEPEETWDFLDDVYRHRRPVVVNLDAGESDRISGQNAYWMIDHKIMPKMSGHNTTLFLTPTSSQLAQGKPFTIGSQTLTKAEDRLADMDRCGIDMQVVFPTIFLEPLSEDLAFEANLMHSYNVRMSKVCAPTGGRIRWTAVLPMRDAELAAKEVRAAKELGAVGAAIFGTAGGELLHSPHLDPVWAAAVEAGLPICVHTGWSHPGLTWSATDIYAAQIIGFTLPVIIAFHSFVGAGILDRFPALKVAFLEAGSDWLPYMLHRMEHYRKVDQGLNWGMLGKKRPSDYLRENEVYFSCEGDEPLLPKVIELVGANRIMISADMPHAEARDDSLDEIKDRHDLSDSDKEWLLGSTAAAFYGI